MTTRQAVRDFAFRGNPRRFFSLRYSKCQALNYTSVRPNEFRRFEQRICGANECVSLQNTCRLQEEYFRTFDSACGLHINMLMTQDHLYVPVFGADAENQQRGQSATLDNDILKVIGELLSAYVCEMASIEVFFCRKSTITPT